MYAASVMKTKVNGHYEIVLLTPGLFLTPPDIFLVEKLAHSHLVKKFPHLYDSGGSLVRSIEPNIGRLSLAKSIRSTISTRFFLTSVLILSPISTPCYSKRYLPLDLLAISSLRATYSTHPLI
jgi:hypothetical protein